MGLINEVRVCLVAGPGERVVGELAGGIASMLDARVAVIVPWCSGCPCF